MSLASLVPSNRPYMAPRRRDVIACAALAAFLAAPALAFSAKRMTLRDGDADCAAYVSIHNRAGVYNETETLETAHGPVSIAYTTNGGHNATDHDEIEVVSLPIGLFARPMEAEIPDGDTLDICLFEYAGA